MTAVSGGKALNFKGFVLTALWNWTSVQSWITCLNFKTKLADKLKSLKSDFKGLDLLNLWKTSVYVEHKYTVAYGTKCCVWDTSCSYITLGLNQKFDTSTGRELYYNRKGVP